MATSWRLGNGHGDGEYGGAGDGLGQLFPTSRVAIKKTGTETCLAGGGVMDATTISLAVGLLVSLAITEVFGLTAGGMIVPGYFALSVHQPVNSHLVY